MAPFRVNCKSKNLNDIALFLQKMASIPQQFTLGVSRITKEVKACMIFGFA